MVKEGEGVLQRTQKRKDKRETRGGEGKRKIKGKRGGREEERGKR